MIVFKTSAELRNYIDSQRNLGRSIGFIPTMGALHKGHISLINSARQSQKLTICSIFVNPAQFNDKQDFDKYPHAIADDIVLLSAAGCDVLFLPTLQEIYPNGPENAQEYHFGFLETVFEGAQRPGHFNGVGKVVAILLNMVQPDALYMGSKDYQQCAVVKNLCKQMGLADKIEFVACPTQREADGLAMSSRNRRLNEPQRALAAIIYQCLVSIQSKSILNSPFAIVAKECADLMKAKKIEPEYIAIADADSLKPLSEFDPNKKMVALIAAKVGNVRLIDNMIIN